MTSVTINGKCIQFSEGKIVIVGKSGSIIINGDEVSQNNQGTVCLKIEGGVADIDADGDVECGDVRGNVSARGSVKCEDVDGNVDSGGSVNCGNVGGNIDAGGSVNCGDVGGDIDAGEV